MEMELNSIKVETFLLTEEVETSIKKKLESISPYPSNPSIYKVPQHFRKGKEECYFPTLVSIGPTHYGHPSLEPMQEIKLRHLQWFLKRGNQTYSLNDYIKMLADNETLARSYYEDIKNKKADDEFVEVMLLDSAFIITLFFVDADGVDEEDHHMVETLKSTDHLHPLLVKDLFLMENQLPFFILDHLYNAAFGATNSPMSFIDITCRSITINYLPGNRAAETVRCKTLLQKSNIKHLVDFLRLCCQPSGELREDKNKKSDDLQEPLPVDPYTVTELKAAGVTFVAGTSANLLDIKFSTGVLEIPTFIINSRTEAICRNLLFFEYTQYSEDPNYLVDYFTFLDALINTPEDVKVLVNNNIIINGFGGEEAVVNLFTSIKEHTAVWVSKFYYKQVTRDLNAYANTNCNKWMAMLRRDYFGQPWTAISVIYAILLLILTVLQVFTGFKALPTAKGE